MEIRKKCWQAFCSSEWPTFEVGWPRDGTFNLDTILQVKEKNLSNLPSWPPRPGSLHHYLGEFIQRPSPWVKPFVPPVGTQNLVTAARPSSALLIPKAEPAARQLPLLRAFCLLFPVQEQTKPRIQAPLVLPDTQPSSSGMADFSLPCPRIDTEC